MFFLFIAGAVSFFRSADKDRRFWVGLAFLWLCLPLATVMLLHFPVLNEWRHFFFVYPALLIVALHGLDRLGGVVRSKALLSAALIAAHLPVAWFMVRSHPYQNVYFNRLAGPSMAVIAENYDMDYWGLSYQRALEHILRTDADPVIPIYAVNRAGVNLNALSEEDRRRIRVVRDYRKAKYLITSARGRVRELLTRPEVYSVEVGGAKLMSVYRASQ